MDGPVYSGYIGERREKKKHTVNLFLLSFVNRENKSVMGLIGFFFRC